MKADSTPGINRELTQNRRSTNNLQNLWKQFTVGEDANIKDNDLQNQSTSNILNDIFSSIMTSTRSSSPSKVSTFHRNHIKRPILSNEQRATQTIAKKQLRNPVDSPSRNVSNLEKSENKKTHLELDRIENRNSVFPSDGGIYRYLRDVSVSSEPPLYANSEESKWVGEPLQKKSPITENEEHCSTNNTEFEQNDKSSSLMTDISLLAQNTPELLSTSIQFVQNLLGNTPDKRKLTIKELRGLSKYLPEMKKKAEALQEEAHAIDTLNFSQLQENLISFEWKVESVITNVKNGLSKIQQIRLQFEKKLQATLNVPSEVLEQLKEFNNDVKKELDSMEVRVNSQGELLELKKTLKETRDQVTRVDHQLLQTLKREEMTTRKLRNAITDLKTKNAQLEERLLDLFHTDEQVSLNDIKRVLVISKQSINQKSSSNLQMGHLSVDDMVSRLEKIEQSRQEYEIQVATDDMIHNLLLDHNEFLKYRRKRNKSHDDKSNDVQVSKQTPHLPIENENSHKEALATPSPNDIVNRQPLSRSSKKPIQQNQEPTQTTPPILSGHASPVHNNSLTSSTIQSNLANEDYGQILPINVEVHHAQVVHANSNPGSVSISIQSEEFIENGQKTLESIANPALEEVNSQVGRQLHKNQISQTTANGNLCKNCLRELNQFSMIDLYKIEENQKSNQVSEQSPNISQKEEIDTNQQIHDEHVAETSPISKVVLPCFISKCIDTFGLLIQQHAAIQCNIPEQTLERQMVSL